jgi:hypothetical protein
MRSRRDCKTHICYRLYPAGGCTDRGKAPFTSVIHPPTVLRDASSLAYVQPNDVPPQLKARQATHLIQLGFPVQSSNTSETHRHAGR